MARRIPKEKPTKLAKAGAAALEPLKDVVAKGGNVEDWTDRFAALSVEGQNKALRQNPELLELLAGNKVAAGDMLIGPLAAENSNDRAQGEQTFLTVVKPLRDRLVKEYEIKTGAEFMLLDALVLSYYQYIRAANNLHSYTAYGKSYNYETLVRYAQTYLARANELFLRNLEAMRLMKAAPFIIKIEQAGQVNVGEKQINVAGKPPSGAADVILACDNSGATALSSANVRPRALPEPDEGP
jgi:hypothetical protein